MCFRSENHSRRLPSNNKATYLTHKIQHSKQWWKKYCTHKKNVHHPKKYDKSLTRRALIALVTQQHCAVRRDREGRFIPRPTFLPTRPGAGSLLPQQQQQQLRDADPPFAYGSFRLIPQHIANQLENFESWEKFTNLHRDDSSHCLNTRRIDELRECLNLDG